MIDRGGSVLDRMVLNGKQEEAVKCDVWPQLVFAGAGSGKTRVLTSKIAYLIESQNVFPGNIFAATFTNKAAREMFSRVESLVNFPCEGLWIGTFHSLCARILRREGHILGYSSSFSIYDTSDQKRLIKKIMQELEINERTLSPRKLLHGISNYKVECIPPEKLSMNQVAYYQKQVILAYKLYQKSLKKFDAMDFDDLISNVVYLFRNSKAVLEKYIDTFKYILVDEYQDTNASQFKLVDLLGREHKKIFAVGDDDQSIYAWRGARIENILSFEKEYGCSSIFKLEQNYRSTQPVLDFANEIIKINSKRTPKKLWTGKTEGEQIVVALYRDDRHEARSIADKIAENRKKGIKPGETAVLFRTNAQSRPFEDAFRRINIPYVIVGGTGFYERKEIKDCLAYMRILVNSEDDISCERVLNVPHRGIGQKTREKLYGLSKERGLSLFNLILTGAYRDEGLRAQNSLDGLNQLFRHLLESRKNKTVPCLVDDILKLTGYYESLKNEDTEEAENRLENIDELVNAVISWSEEKKGGSAEQFLEEISLATDVDRWDKSDDAVNCMTLHSAKGLEFKTVYIAGVEEGLIPSRRNFDDFDKLEEECRLLYVGATRAKNKLECSHVIQRRRYGAFIPMEPSRYLEKIDKEKYDYINYVSFYNREKPAPVKKNTAVPRGVSRGKRSNAGGIDQTRYDYDYFSQDTTQQYTMGQNVHHSRYGNGKIMNISGFGTDVRITVMFDSGEKKKMMAKYVNLDIT